MCVCVILNVSMHAYHVYPFLCTCVVSVRLRNTGRDTKRVSIRQRECLRDPDLDVTYPDIHRMAVDPDTVARGGVFVWGYV